MNAPVDLNEQRAERRRQSTMSNMQSELRSLALDLERIRQLGNDSAAVALVTMRRELTAIMLKAGTLHDEFVELADLERTQQQLIEDTEHGSE